MASALSTTQMQSLGGINRSCALSLINKFVVGCGRSMLRRKCLEGGGPSRCYMGEVQRRAGLMRLIVRQIDLWV